MHDQKNIKNAWFVYVINPATLQVINLLAPEFFFLILTHPVYKTWITQAPNMLDLWNKLHFE